MPTKIEWTDETWNPVTGCTPVSPGCANCYALRLAPRLQAMGQVRYARGTEVTGHWDALYDLRILSPRRRPRMIFTCSMSDLFHERVSEDLIAGIFEAMAFARQHTFQVLTKRPHRALGLAESLHWPPNLWLGASIENADFLHRVPPLLSLPVPVHFLSLEPLLGPIPNLRLQGIDWVIVGGETGPGKRPMAVDWPRQIRDQCIAAGVPFFFKRWGHLQGLEARLLDGRTWEERP